MKTYKTFFPTCSGRRSAVGWSGFLSGAISHAFRAGFFSPLKGRHFSGEKAASLQVFYSKEKKPSVTQSYCVEEAGKATFYSFQKEAKLPFLFVNRPHSGTHKFRIPEML